MSSQNNNTSNRILKATWELLEDSSGLAVRMSDIAKRAGVSRQALYLHFKTRTDILIATTLYVDDVNDVEGLLRKSRGAETGPERLDRFIEAWGNYIPVVYNVCKALMALQGSDEAANSAWKGRMNAMRAGCEAAIIAIDKDGLLSDDFTQKTATDSFWMLLSVRNWELLTQDCGWSQEDYISKTQHSARALFLK